MGNKGYHEKVFEIDNIGNVKLSIEVISYNEVRFHLSNVKGNKAFIQYHYETNDYLASENILSILDYKNKEEYESLIVHLHDIGKGIISEIKR